MEYEGQRHSADEGETFPQILRRLIAHYDGISGTEIGRRTGMSGAAVSTWLSGKRIPRPDTIRALSAAFPAFSEAELFAAAGRKAPGPLSPAAEERLLELFRGLTKEQQEMKEIEMRALRDANRT
ncbi:helix-turn-helix domain-containing protein [Streptomyces sp. NPDC050504]|uniref:helix-turn-helix domain-containing protein n=1 Tax=Streptomyces sp. NPDC050504 TaxID=3365618 RepID=UPI003789A06F